jgi:twitching motility protein PilT
MSEHLRDPELDRLIQELNQRTGGGAGSAASFDADDLNNLDDLDEVNDGGGLAGDRGASGGRFEREERAGAALGDVGLLSAAGPRRVAAAGTAGRGAKPEPAVGLALVADLPARVDVGQGEALGVLLAEAIRRGASDLLLLSGLPPVYRVDGRLKRGESAVLDGDDIARLFAPQLTPRVHRELEERGSADFSLRLPGGPGGLGGAGTARGERDGAMSEGLEGVTGVGGVAGALPALDGAGGGAGRSGGSAWRFRVNLHRQRGQLAAALRSLPREVPTLAALNLPAGLAELVKPSRGLVLVCGPTGSGKSSTLAALIGEINRTRTAHIITIEDPVEYEHRSARSLIEHVEVGRDARTFNEALRAALRQDPDVILVGEMRDLDTVATAVTAAETGHLVLATLHSNDAVQAMHRIVDVFPPVQQQQIRQQLALSLHAVVAQQLVPRADGRGRIPAVELMLASFPVRSHIRNDQLQKLYNEITIGRRMGMISFEESLAQHVREGRIDLEEARVRASHPEELDARMRG